MIRLAAVLAILAQPAFADISAKFVESAPKDSFTFVNTSACATGPIDLTVDLSGSAAGLIFDTTGNGAGVEVFQPFELVAGGAELKSVEAVTDGDTSVKLRLKDLPAGGKIAFTIDVDDTLAASSNGQIMVSGGEIAGASVSMTAGGDTTRTTFDNRGNATLALKDCQS